MIWAGNPHRPRAQSVKTLGHHLADQLGPCTTSLSAGISHQQAPGFAYRLQHSRQVHAI